LFGHVVKRLAEKTQRQDKLKLSKTS
jgi:hypothetical protein